MKTLFQIQKLIDTEKQILENEAVTKKGKKVIQNKIEFFEFCLRYVETKPRPEFIQSEIERLSARIEKINIECEEFKSKILIAKHKALKDYTILKKQLKTLNFISC